MLRAALAGDHDDDVLAGDAADRFVDLDHRRAAADDGAVHIGVRRGLGNHGRHAHPPRHLERLADDPRELEQVERLEQVVVGLLLHRFDGAVGVVGRGDEDDGDAGVELPKPPIDLQPREVGQSEVEQDRVRRPCGSLPDAVLARAGRVDLVADRVVDAVDLFQDQVRAVVDDQQSDHGDTSGTRSPLASNQRPPRHSLRRAPAPALNDACRDDLKRIRLVTPGPAPASRPTRCTSRWPENDPDTLGGGDPAEATGSSIRPGYGSPTGISCPRLSLIPLPSRPRTGQEMTRTWSADDRIETDASFPVAFLRERGGAYPGRPPD